MVFNEALHKRGTGAQGGQFVAADGTKSSAIGYDGRSGSGYGSKGGDSNVKALQKELNRLGLGDASGKALVVDGKFGPKTTAATKRLQRKLGLPADGKITPALLKRIKGLKKSVSYKDSVSAKKAAPARKAAPGKKPAPPPLKKVTPGQKAATGKTTAPTAKAKQPIRRSTGWPAEVGRHLPGRHNQQAHANRLGRPSNVAGKTGLGKATAALADKPEEGPARAAPQSDADRVTSAIADLGEPGDLVSLARVRDALPDMDRAAVTETLLDLDRKRIIQLDPDPNRKALTDRAKAAAIPLGGEDMHLVTLLKPPGPREKKR